MGRGKQKIEIKKIEDSTTRQVTFSKRRLGLLKKAEQLAILCTAEVAILVFSNTGKLYEFASTCMDGIISRYNERTKSEYDHNDRYEICNLKSEISELRLSLHRMTGKVDLGGLSLQELQHLEDELQEGLLVVEEKKEELENSKSRKRRKPKMEANDSHSIAV